MSSGLYQTENGHGAIEFAHAAAREGSKASGERFQEKQERNEKMKRVTTGNAFAEFRFADADGRKRLCGWLIAVVNGKKPLPLVIIGPQCSGKTTMLRLLGALLGGSIMGEPSKVDDVREFWECLQIERFVAVDDARMGWRISEAIAGGVHRVRIPYTTSAVTLRANAARAVAVCAGAVKNDSDLQFLRRYATVIGLEPVDPQPACVRSAGRYREWLVYASAADCDKG